MPLVCPTLRFSRGPRNIPSAASLLLDGTLYASQWLLPARSSQYLQGNIDASAELSGIQRSWNDASRPASARLA